MMSIMCVGTDEMLLRSRCQVLKKAGHQTVWSYPAEALNRIATESFDLAIISMSVPEQDAQQIIAKAPSGLSCVYLQHFLWPEDLIQLVATELRKLLQRRHRVITGAA